MTSKHVKWPILTTLFLLSLSIHKNFKYYFSICYSFWKSLTRGIEIYQHNNTRRVFWRTDEESRQCWKLGGGAKIIIYIKYKWARIKIPGKQNWNLMHVCVRPCLCWMKNLDNSMYNKVGLWNKETKWTTLGKKTLTSFSLLKKTNSQNTPEESDTTKCVGDWGLIHLLKILQVHEDYSSNPQTPSKMPLAVTAHLLF